MENLSISPLTQSILNDYTESLKNKRSKQEYFYIINSFCKSCGVDYINASLEDFQGYFENLQTAAIAGNISYKTICLRYSVLINFSSFIRAYAENYGIKNFTNYVIKVPKPSVSVMIKPSELPAMEQMDRLLAEAKNDPTMYAMIALVFKCALTVEQVLSLKVENFINDSENNSGIYLPYQYKADRYIKIPNDIRIILNDFVIATGRNTDYLFLNRYGTPLTDRVVQKRFKALLKKARGNSNEEKWNFSLQDVRNLSITLMLQGNAKPEDVANYVGIDAKWMQRYDKAVEEYRIAPCDFINISIKPYK